MGCNLGSEMRVECLNLEGRSDMDEKWGQHGCKWDHGTMHIVKIWMKFPLKKTWMKMISKMRKSMRRIEKE
jgi:hypothetical protein